MRISGKPLSVRQLLTMLLAMACASCSGVGAQSYNSWQSMETVMDASESPLTPDQDFSMTIAPVTPQAPPAIYDAPAPNAWYSSPGPVPSQPSYSPSAGSSWSNQPATSYGAPPQHGISQSELQGQAIQNGRASYRHSNSNHMRSGALQYSYVYVVGADGKPVALPFVVPHGAQSTQPVIIIQQAAPTAAVQQTPQAQANASVVPAAPAAAAATPAAAAGDAKQATWKSVVNSLAGNASAVPGNLGKGMSVAAPVLNAILQGL